MDDLTIAFTYNREDNTLTGAATIGGEEVTATHIVGDLAESLEWSRRRIAEGLNALYQMSTEVDLAIE